MFGSNVSTPSSATSCAISTIATTGAPERLAISTVSPKWSPWPWVSRITVGSTSSAAIAAFGLPLKNGSLKTRVSPSESSKQAWPRKRTSICRSVLLVGGFVFAGTGLGGGIRAPVCPGGRPIELTRQLESDRDPHHHSQSRLFGNQRLDFPLPV